MKKASQYLVNFFKGLWALIKSFKTWQGILSLALSFTIVVGWALAFIGIGYVSGEPWFITIGSAVVTFWTFFPVSPMWLTIIFLALIIQRFVLLDKKTLSSKEIIQSIKNGGILK